MTPSSAKKIETYICRECQAKQKTVKEALVTNGTGSQNGTVQSTGDQELHCICRTTYDPTRYVAIYTQ